jgi:hypothetical protein
LYRQYHIIYKVTLAFALLFLIAFRKYIFEIILLNNFRNNNFGRFVLKLITNCPCSSYHIFSCKLFMFYGNGTSLGLTFQNFQISSQNTLLMSSLTSLQLFVSSLSTLGPLYGSQGPGRGKYLIIDTSFFQERSLYGKVFSLIDNSSRSIGHICMGGCTNTFKNNIFLIFRGQKDPPKVGFYLKICEIE